MPPVNYLSIYLLGVIGSFAATVGGVVFCYNGMSAASYLTYKGMQTTTYFFDKTRYDLYFNGLVYCTAFAIALMMLLMVIMIPSPNQIQRRMAATPFAGGAPQAGAPPVQAAPAAAEAPEIDLAPDLSLMEDEDDEDFEDGIQMTETDDSDVIYGTGRITDAAHHKFILENTDSSIKFLMRKELDGRPLKADQEEIYEAWQKRGLSRGRVRKHIFKIMGWDNIPDIPIHEIVSQVKGKAYEAAHAES